MQDNIEPLAFSPDAAAQRVGVSQRQIYVLMTKGELRSIKVGKRRLILDTELKAYLARKVKESASA